jgi:lipopolysaccharide biosynthesis protein
LHIHVFYPDLVEDICERLNLNTTPVDLFLTVPEEIELDEARRRCAAYRRGRIEFTVVPNRGRDIGALLTGLAESALWNYEFIGHLHTKGSIWMNSPTMVEYWRSFMLENALGGKYPMMDTILSALETSPDVGLVFPDDPYVVGWGRNRPFAESLATRLHISQPLPQAFNFPVGSFFWARSASLNKLRALRLQWEDYPAEPAPSDGSLLHALERLFPFVVAEAGYQSAVTHVPGITR